MYNVDWGEEGPPKPGEKMTDTQHAAWKKAMDEYWDRSRRISQIVNVIFWTMLVVTIFTIGFVTGFFWR